MRTTVTLDPDTDAIVRKLMRGRKLTFKQALNAAIRAGSPSRQEVPDSFTRAYRMGRPMIDLDKASHFAAELEDGEILRKLALGK